MVSILIPCYNEEAVIPELYGRLSSAADKLNESYEVVVVDDGSSDASWDLLAEISQRDNRWKIVRFSRNFGHQAALSAALYHAKGDCAILIDADLQDPPEEISRFIEKWREGFQVVYAVRAKRKENIFKRALYKIFYLLLASVANIQIPLDSGDFCLMDRKVIDILKNMPEQNMFIRGVRAWAGFRQIGIEYERSARAAGEPKYTFSKLIKLALDGIFSFSTLPLRLTTYFGFIVALFAFLFGFLTLLQRIFIDFSAKLGIAPVPGFATTVISIFFMGGIQLICFGILGEYVGRIYEQVKGRPLWVISEKKGFRE
jgi:dolichol-phosphate mannosyltransferase